VSADDELDRVFEMGREWMRASLADRPGDPDQQRRIRVLLATRPERVA
jgi:hypothetical protein